MMRHFATAVLASLMLFSFATASALEKAVTIKGSIKPEAEKANHFTVTVQMDIASGWHTYDEVGEGTETPTSLKLKLPDGATAVGDWNRPVSTDGSAVNSTVFEGLVSFSKSVTIQPTAYGKSIDVTIAYQACNDQICNRPQNKTITIVIPKEESPSSAGLFERPVMIRVKDAPLNTVAMKRFPSPGIFDVDGDGQTELVIGDLMGGVGVYENTNTTGTGDPAWGPREDLKGIEGDAIETPNW